MISQARLKWDGWIQLSLGLLCLISWMLSWQLGIWLALSLLLLWQTGSALELYLDYQHRSRKLYLWWAPLTLGLAIWSLPTGLMVGLAGILTYAGHTLHDYRIIRRRPRSFWEL